jgi:hypothetical protein
METTKSHKCKTESCSTPLEIAKNTKKIGMQTKQKRYPTITKLKIVMKILRLKQWEKP